jgi:ASC-1-like (ASCH) protein
MQLGLSEHDFSQIKDGSKTVEVRAPSDNKNYKSLKTGDSIIFISEKTGETVTAKVISVSYYQTVEDLFKEIDYRKINPHLLSKDEAVNKLFTIPSYEERIKSGGVYAIKIMI